MYCTFTSPCSVFQNKWDFHFFSFHFLEQKNRNSEWPCMVNQRQSKDLKLGTNLTQKQPSVPA